MARKAIEKEFRKLNLRCHVEHVRGQHIKGKDKKGKYQTLTQADHDTLRFYACHSSGRAGLATMKRVQCLEDKVKKITRCLEDKARSHHVAIRDSELAQSKNSFEQEFASRSERAATGYVEPAAGPAAPNLDFAKPGEVFEQSSDIRSARKKCSNPGMGTTSVSGSSLGVGASLKLSQKHRELLMMIGFNNCHDLLTLPTYADLRRGYKKASFTLHPDKRCSEVATASSDINVKSAGSKLSALSFQDFQEQYRNLLAMFYDSDKQDFNASVKMHLKASIKRTKVGKNK